jgi:hypothetical protein
MMNKTHITSLISSGHVEHGISELVDAIHAMGLQPERACAGHGKNSLNFPELPYVSFRAPELGKAYRLSLAAVMATTHGYAWWLRAGFPSNRGADKEIPERQPRELRFFLELHLCTALYTNRLLVPNKLSDTKIQEAIALMTRLANEAIHPDWWPVDLTELGFL